MTKGKLRRRIETLEAKREGEDVQHVRLWWADKEAGLWREGIGPHKGSEDEGSGHTRPMTASEIKDAKASGQHVILLTGLPQKGGRR